MRKRTSWLLILFMTMTFAAGGQWLQNPYTYGMSAADFTDVKTSYWGYPYIDFSANKGIINGYLTPKGTYQFLPETQVTREEAMSMLYRALAAAGKLESQEDFSADYQQLFTAHKIAGWAQKYVAYGLKFNLVTEAELLDFTDDESGYGKLAPREQAAVWTGKAMKKSLAPAYSLIYSDKDDISSGALPYIDLLYRQGIMQGDDTKMFHPANGIKRAEFAAIANRVFEAAKTDDYQVEKEVQSYRGTIVSVDSINNLIMMTQSDGTARVIQINAKTQIVIDGKLNYNGLKGMKTGVSSVVAWGAFLDQSAGQSANALQLHVITKTESRVGLITAIEKVNGTTSVLTVKNADGDEIHYVVDRNSQILNTPVKGKEVTFICDGVKILEIK